MSVVAHSPYSGAKRLFESDSPDTFDLQQHQQGVVPKRARYFGSPSGRCQPLAPQNAGHIVPQNTISALKALFPGMDEKAITAVLEECGPNIDAAIKKLGQLRLAQEQAQAAEAAAAQPASAQGPAASSAPDTSSAPQRPAQDPPAADANQTGEQWVETLVQQMAAAKDMTDARQRAGSVLQAFEQFMMGRVKSSSSSDVKLEEARRENHILKRAVQIQNARMQEALQQKDKEVQQLQQTVEQYREKLQTAEVNNYALRMHLQQATSSGLLSHSQRPPDVY